MVKKLLTMRQSDDSAVWRRAKNNHTVYTTDYDKTFPSYSYRNHNVLASQVLIYSTGYRKMHLGTSGTKTLSVGVICQLGNFSHLKIFSALHKWISIKQII